MNDHAGSDQAGSAGEGPAAAPERSRMPGGLVRLAQDGIDEHADEHMSISRSTCMVCQKFEDILAVLRELGDAVDQAARRAADEALLSQPDLQESLAQMRRGEGVVRVRKPDDASASAETVTTGGTPMTDSAGRSRTEGDHEPHAVQSRSEVPCRYCRQPIGVRCVEPSGRVPTYPHSVRFSDAIEFASGQATLEQLTERSDVPPRPPRRKRGCTTADASDQTVVGGD